MKKEILNSIIALLIMSICSCNNSNDTATSSNDTTMNKKDSRDVSANKPGSLFDGSSFSGWHSFNGGKEIKSWAIEDSAMVCLGTAKDAHGGDIVTDNEYENFELTWDWKVTKGANSGVMYHVVEGSQYQAPYETGPEYQVIDDIGFPAKLEEWQKAGADYAMYLANDKKKLNPVGEWNTSKIVFNKGHVEHWLNGEKIVEFEAWSDDWTKKKNEGKWKDYPGYGVAKKGKIALQDHGNKVFYKNITILSLPNE
ncbi:MAG: DUF1080 domain-containing protein [Chitinophagales bacterium]